MPSKQLITQIKELKKYIDSSATRVQKVSNWSIGQQIEHSLKVIIGVSQTTIESNPEDYKANFNFARLMVFMLGRIPRGKGKAPKVVLPSENISSKTELLALADKATAIVKQLDELPPKANFNHLYFGILNLKQTQYFLGIHTNHHLKIIHDIKGKKL